MTVKKHSSTTINPESILAFVTDIKSRIRNARLKALRGINKEMINLYWDIGKSIHDKQKAGWGKSIVENLSQELQNEFPGTRGYSVSNLWYMAQFYKEYNGNTILESLIREIGWTQNVLIFKSCKKDQERQFYITAVAKFGWTVNVLEHQIENKTFEKYLLNQTNFNKILPDSVKNHALLAVKDHYTFDFIELSDEHSEYELEESLIKNIRQFLIEMGGDYTFIGNQYKVVVDNDEYFVDLLLYHRRIQALIAIELKIGNFKPEYKGKMEFYLEALNEKVKLPHENDSIGIIICKTKKRTVVEYSLRNATKPIGVATYSTTATLPAKYRHLLPDTEQIEKQLKQFMISDIED